MGGLNEALHIPGISNAWTMPIKDRIDMLTTGVRTPLGIKVLGSDLHRDSSEIGDADRAGACTDVAGHAPASTPSAPAAATFSTSP